MTQPDRKTYRLQDREHLHHVARRSLWDATVLHHAAHIVEPEFSARLTQLFPVTGTSTAGIAESAHRAAVVAGRIHALDMDDTYLGPVRAHLSCTVLGAVLGTGATGDHPIADILDAYTVGYDIATRIGLVLGARHASHWHPTATLGAIGAAAGVATLVGVDLPRSVAIASDRAIGNRHFLYGSRQSKWLHAAFAAHTGPYAVEAANLGFDIDDSLLWGPSGFMDSFAAELSQAEFGAWEDGVSALVNNQFKLYPCMHGLHPIATLVADDERLVELAREPDVAITLTLPTERSAGSGQWPTDTLDARLNARYVTAAAIVEGGLAWSVFEPAYLHSDRAREVHRRVVVESDDELSQRANGEPSARLTLHRGGSVLLEREQIMRLQRWDTQASLAGLDKMLTLKHAQMATGLAPVSSAARQVWLEADASAPAATPINELFFRNGSEG